MQYVLQKQVMRLCLLQVSAIFAKIIGSRIGAA